MYYSDEIIEEVRSKNDIVDVISTYVKLQKKGSSYFGLCPFHNEKSPSFSVSRQKQMYYCFGCGATGDVIDFVSQLRGIGSKEAAILLAQDFAIPYEDSAGKTNRPRQQNTDEQNYQHMERYCSRVLLDYYQLLCRWKEDYAPQTPENGYHPRFVEALQKLSLVEYLLDELLCGDIQARASVVIEYGEEVRKIEQRMAELAAADEAAAQNAGRQHGTADER